MTYRVEITPAAARQLGKLDPPVARRIQGAIALLANDPRPPNCEPLRGRSEWRIRVGNYRVLYAIKDDVLLVIVLTLGHSRQIYDR